MTHQYTMRQQRGWYSNSAVRRFAFRRYRGKRQHLQRRINNASSLGRRRQPTSVRRQKRNENGHANAPVLDELGNRLQHEKLNLADLLERAFDPAVKHTHDWTWRHFFQHRQVVHRVFGHWASPRMSKSVRETVREWVLTEMEHIAQKESDAIINSGELRKTGKAVDENYFLSYKPRELGARLRGLASGVYRVLATFSRAQQQLSEQWRNRKDMIDVPLERQMITSAIGSLMLAASQRNTYTQSIMGTYFMATGAQRQHFSVLSGMGVTMGYSSIISHGDKATTGRSPGTLGQLSDACRRTARSLASSRIFGVVYDNINMSVRIAEQIVGRKNAQENGTCATAFPLHNVTLDANMKKAPPLTEKSLRLSEDEQKLFRKAMVHTILRIIVNYGGDGFTKHERALKASLPRSADAIDVHRTALHPLPAMEIDENKVTGNIEIIEAVMKELDLDVNSPEHTRLVTIIAGDQLTIARQRAIQHVRVGHEVGFQSWRHIVLMPGLFHAKIADCHGVLESHFGNPSSGPRNPGSLSFHNKCLGRLPIVLSSLPPFRTTRDLIFVSLYARILHCLLLVTKSQNLDEAASKLATYEDLEAAAAAIFDTYADADRVQELREERDPEERAREKAVRDAKKAAKEGGMVDIPEYVSHIQKGDMVFENAVLFIRDALLSREFSDAIKAGDSGRVLIILKLWVFSYRGSGRTKYAHEMLHLLHNVLNVWPEGLRRAILQNWLQNPTGKPNAFVEIDLIQEHLNYWIKRIYKADGDGHSWAWLAMISPTVNVLRELANHVNSELGARQGKKHTTPDLARDINRLMESLEKYEVYIEKPGRVLDYNEKPVPDVIATGMAALTYGASTNPLKDFNAAFEYTRQRHLPAASPSMLSNGPVDLLSGDHGAHELGAEDAVDEMVDETREEDESDEDAWYADDGAALSPTLPLIDGDDVALEMDEFELDEEWDGDEEEA
ncbi:hypothetical protein FB107DRAFT_294881 [Schizophyllum commune]